MDTGRHDYKVISQQDYEKKWAQRVDLNANENVLGYGAHNPYTAPLAMPHWMLSVLDRHVLLTLSIPLITFWQATYALTLGLSNGDTWDGYFYNNSFATGTQLYPVGLTKYYDLFSVRGLVNYVGDWIWIWTTNLLSPLTLFIPFDFWQAWVNGYPLNNWWILFIVWPFNELFTLRGEAGWYLF